VKPKLNKVERHIRRSELITKLWVAVILIGIFGVLFLFTATGHNDAFGRAIKERIVDVDSSL